MARTISNPLKTGVTEDPRLVVIGKGESFFQITSGKTVVERCIVNILYIHVIVDLGSSSQHVRSAVVSIHVHSTAERDKSR